MCVYFVRVCVGVPVWSQPCCRDAGDSVWGSEPTDGRSDRSQAWAETCRLSPAGSPCCCSSRDVDWRRVHNQPRLLKPIHAPLEFAEASFFFFFLNHQTSWFCCGLLWMQKLHHPKPSFGIFAPVTEHPSKKFPNPLKKQQLKELSALGLCQTCRKLYSLEKA